MSTFSPNLRFEIIESGTQAGAWGNTTNVNIGTLIEGAVSGYLSVSVTSANQALTALNGAPDQSRNAMLRLTTTTAAAFAVYAPPSPKEYTIFNDSIYAATIYNATAVNGTTAAGTGVVIPAGKTMTVWSNGASFYQQNTHLIAPTLDAPVLTGIPTAPTAVVATNTTQIATTAFVQAIAALALNTLLPIGSIYTNATNATNPATLLGFGTWVAFGAGRMPVGFNAANPLFDTAEEIGGTADVVVVSHTHTATTTVSGGAHSHTATVSDPGHTHNLRVFFRTINGDSEEGDDTVSSASAGVGGFINSSVTGISVSNSSSTPAMTASTTVATAGVTGVNQNYPPYITVYMWKRTA